eukprot:13964.XXX_573659_573835_1 [CDS] Oithona nana genome sequencing.
MLFLKMLNNILKDDFFFAAKTPVHTWHESVNTFRFVLLQSIFVKCFFASIFRVFAIGF